MSTNDSLVRTLLIIIAVVVLLPVLMMAVMMPMMGIWGGSHMWNGGMWNGTGATWMWFLMWVVGLAIIVGVGYLLYRGVQSPASAKTDPAIEELRTAYARGEISDEEFAERRNRLERES